MLARRDVLRTLALGGGLVVAQPVLAGCGGSGESPPRSSREGALGEAGTAMSTAPRTTGDEDDIPAAARSVQDFTADLYRAVAQSSPGNVIASPYSVAIALAMTVNGARGRTAAEIADVLHAASTPTLNSGLNALTQLVDGRAGEVKRADGSTATLALAVANSLWGQQDTTWVPAFLDALARDYGAGMRLVDYAQDADGAQDAINAWTADHTGDKITDIIPDGALDALTRLVLVNAIYLKAPWEEPFEKTSTKPRPFTRADGSTVQADTMSSGLEQAAYVQGDGYQAARISYAGGELAMTVILPDDPDPSSWEEAMTGSRLADVLDSVREVPMLQLSLPRFGFRSQLGLADPLAGLGMPTAFDSETADLSGMTADERLFISAVLHQGYIAVDEDGTEAAAATAVVMEATSAPLPTPFVVDRPFVFVIHDVETATPLFIGRVSDPTA